MNELGNVTDDVGEERLRARLERARESGERIEVEAAVALGLRHLEALEAASAQAEGSVTAKAHSNLFSLGRLLYRCLSLRDPGEDHAPRISKLRTDVPPELDLLVEYLLARIPCARPLSAREVKAALERIGEALPKRQWPLPKAARKVRFVLAGTVIAIAGAVAFAHWHGATAFSRAAPPGATPLEAGLTSAALAVPTPPEQSVSPTCNPQAVAVFSQGVHWMHDGRWREARALLEQAARMDDACPQIQFRRFEVNANELTLSELRALYREAARLRDALSERDQIVFDSFAAHLNAPSSRSAAVLAILDRGIRQFPNDAEMAMLWSMAKLEAASTRDEVEAGLLGARRAAALDPTSADPWHVQAKALGQLRREDEALAALDRCVAISPKSSDCMHERTIILLGLGQCEEAVAAAKAWISSAPDALHSGEELARALAAAHAPRTDIEDALRASWLVLPEGRRESRALLDRAKLLALSGEFAAAREHLDALERVLASSEDREQRLAAAALSADIRLESGDLAGAGRVADDALIRKDAWVHNFESPVEGIEWEPWLLAVQLRAGHLNPAEWRTAVSRWAGANWEWLSDFERWALGWGPVIGATDFQSKVHIPIEEIVSHMPSGEPSVALRLFRAPWQTARLDAYSGRAYLEIGDIPRATPLLEKGARACHGLEAPLLGARAQLWLGIAREKAGDARGACEAYRFVGAQWGQANPPSTTAREAERRGRALGCGL